MASGLSVTNSNSSLIIDDNYKCYHVHSSGTITNAGSLPNIYGNDLLFVRPTILGATLYASTIAGSYIKATTGNVQWVLLKSDYSLSSMSGYGLVVFSSSGTVTFDSTKATMEPCYTYRTAPPGARLDPVSITLPAKSLAAKTRYINQSSLRIVGVEADGDNPNIGSFIKTAVTWDSDTLMSVFAGPYPENGQGPPADNSWFGTLYFSFVDV